MSPKPTPNYLAGYPPALTEQVLRLIEQDKLGEFLRNAGTLSKVVFDNKLHVIQHALGTHTRISRVQGSKLKTKGNPDLFDPSCRSPIYRAIAASESPDKSGSYKTPHPQGE
jgi:hypothetical protein